MSDPYIELLKVVGSISGLCSATFLLYDRFTKHYPIAFIEARPLTEGSAHIVPFLYLKNASDRPILVSWTDGNDAGFRVARDGSLRSLIDTLFEGATTISLSAGVETILPLHRPRSYEEIDDENVIEWEATWQHAQPILWRVPRKLRVQIRKRDLAALVDGYASGRSGAD